MAEAHQNIFKVEKLNHDNYSSWAFRMALLLEHHGCDGILSEQGTTAEAAWNKLQRKALGIIVLSVERNQEPFIKSCKTGTEAWNALKEQHQHVTLGAKIRTMRKVFRTKLQVGNSMKEHLNKFTLHIDELRELGEDFKEQIQVAILLSSLNDEYNTVVTGMESWEESKLNLKTVKAKLIDEWERKKDDQSDSACGFSEKQETTPCVGGKNALCRWKERLV
jgi:gag-polypeptide of LTR copia-type